MSYQAASLKNKNIFPNHSAQNSASNMEFTGAGPNGNRSPMNSKQGKKKL